GYDPNYQIVVTRKNNSDNIKVQVEMSDAMVSESADQLNAREKKLVAGLKGMLGILAEVNLVVPKTITRSEGKAVRVIDMRNLYENK
ncbi:MAG: phenylacetate--CoA ligase, partial [Lachnospiraceae bacterium]|nr:phenylacetate--CoA ligase [Lachnospiraceae bacterium]